MKVSLFKKDSRLYLQLPEGFTVEGDLEFFELKTGYYLLAHALGDSAKPAVALEVPSPSSASGNLSPQEISILKKLLSVRFEKRTPVHFSTALTPDEQTHIAKLLAQKRISIYKSQKYPEGVYNISDDVYSLLQKQSSAELPPRAFVDPQSPNSRTALDSLSSKGYAVIADAREAYEVSEQLRKSPNTRRNTIAGVKSFDGKFYAVSSTFFQSASSKIIAILDQPMTVEQLARSLEIDAQGIRAVISILADRGDVIEKRKDVFTRA